MGGYGDVQLLREDGLRLDGHKVDERSQSRAGILPADGSAWVQHGLNVAVCAVYGPCIHARYRDRTSRYRC